MHDAEVRVDEGTPEMSGGCDPPWLPGACAIVRRPPKLLGPVSAPQSAAQPGLLYAVPDRPRQPSTEQVLVRVSKAVIAEAMEQRTRIGPWGIPPRHEL